MNSPSNRRILALEPYYGGSHQAFLDGWARRSCYDFTTLGLPAFSWKWRMRHAPTTLAAQVQHRLAAGERWDVIFCSDMLSLTEFRGLVDPAVARLPAVVYFHENQLTYPVRNAKNHDLHFAFTNIVTAFNAEEVWFNSGFHRDDFLYAAEDFLRKMPDHQPLEMISAIGKKSLVQPPGIEPFLADTPRTQGPLHIVWAARWEHDKNPEDFFAALEVLLAAGVEFKVSVLGEAFREVPAIFAEYETRLAGRIVRWGFQPSREAYAAALSQADVFVSTANHEFFGIAAAEAMAAGCLPLLPDRLAYPELVTDNRGKRHHQHLYDGNVRDLARRLTELADLKRRGDFPAWTGRDLTRHLLWPQRVLAMDAQIDRLVRQASS